MTASYTGLGKYLVTLSSFVMSGISECTLQCLLLMEGKQKPARGQMLTKSDF